jgi:Asp-tRNA(Asn)/Glu-tRNA(Gln) amidotransferase B subunit
VAWVAQVIAQEPKAVADIKAGKLTASGRLVGMAMKLSGGKADPAQIKAEVFRQLGVPG